MKPSLFVSAILFSTGALAACGGANNAKLSEPVSADIDGDGDLDLLLVADFNSSRIFENQGHGTFANSPARTV